MIDAVHAPGRDGLFVGQSLCGQKPEAGRQLVMTDREDAVDCVVCLDLIWSAEETE